MAAHMPQCAFGGKSLFLSSTIVGPGDGVRVISLGGRVLNLLSHLAIFFFSLGIVLGLYLRSKDFTI